MAQSAARPRNHVVIIDGTMSRIDDGSETNAGLLFKLLSDFGPNRDQTVHYDRGVQADRLANLINLAAGIGINQSIRDAYAALCSRYAAGDSIYLFGYSRGGYAVRSLAGLIDRIGLIRRNHATERRVIRAFRYYQAPQLSDAARGFRERFCDPKVEVQVLGVWDTVRALGLPYPLLNRLAPMATEFHDHRLAPTTRNGFHALALDENRTAFEPLPWRVTSDWHGHCEQAWFPGAHSDIGGHILARPEARTLSNIPLVWMLERAVAQGLILPDTWSEEFPMNPAAPMHGSYRGSARFFLSRAPRRPLKCSSEYLHPSLEARQKAIPGYRPRARLTMSENAAVPAL